MIRFDAVEKSLGRGRRARRILTGQSFTLPRGRRLALMGRNGAGKSSFLKLVSGTLKPDRGSITRAGRVSWPVGFSGGFSPLMTGREVVQFVSRIHGADPRAAMRFMRAQAGLGDALDRPMRTYSSGMQARLGFTLSMAIEFDCYLIDEITAVGDAGFLAHSQDLLRRRLEGRSLIMVSHSPATIRSYCDCGLLLEAGRLRFYDTVDDLIGAYGELVLPKTVQSHA